MKRHFNMLFRQKNDITWIQLFRYFYVAGSDFIVDFGSLYVFTEYFGIYDKFDVIKQFLDKYEKSFF
jgi:hypothetical protein